MKKRIAQASIICILMLILILLSSSGALKDGVYTPKSFYFSGGSGKVVIGCDEVRVREGRISADIYFSSPNYSYVKVGDEIYYGEYPEGFSHFEIPVTPDREMEITGCTTAMSEPHEIKYTIFVSLKEADAVAEPDTNPGSRKGAGTDIEGEGNVKNDPAPPKINGLNPEKKMELKYAEGFNVYYYSGGYKVISVRDGRNYLIVPWGVSAPEMPPEEMRVIYGTDNIYLAATGAMSFFYALNAQDHIRYTGTKEDGWFIDGPKEDLEKGSMIFAGKYSAPDFELLLKKGCSFAIESTMILHCPEIMEELERLGIPVFIDCSSYEGSAQGRSEWIKAYAAMIGKEEEAEKLFNELEISSGLDRGFPDTGKTVAFFYINNSGLAVMRREDDYITDLIRKGGGVPVLADSNSDADMGNGAEISMESFYDLSCDADYLIYNGTIDSAVRSLSDMLSKNSLLGAFKAVKNGNVYIAEKSFYQSTDRLPLFAGDVNLMLKGGDSADMEFLRILN